MIPFYIARLADLIFPNWADLEEDDLHEVIKAAHRIHAAGYRQVVATEGPALLPQDGKVES